MAASTLVWAIWRGEWTLLPPREDETRQVGIAVRWTPLVIGLAFSGVAYLAFTGNRFTQSNLILWFVGLAGVVWAFWQPQEGTSHWTTRLRSFVSRPQWSIPVSRWTLLVLAAFALAVFFRVYQLNEVPPEMVSDHAEKLWDVRDILNGQTSIFFPRNTGREFFQMYLTAAVIKVFNTGLSFTSLKIGTVLGGLVTLVYIYLLGKEMGNPRVGLLAMTFAGIAYWPNLISRIALRFTLYPLFYAPTLYYFLRGTRTKNRNYFILSGLCLGLGLHGYSPFRMVPIAIVVAVGLYLLHTRSSGERRNVIWGLLIITVVSLIVFLPLLRYTVENPEMVSFRTMTRLGTTERPLPGPPVQIFLQNLWNALTMFAWDNGEVWVISMVHRPILDIVSAALFHLGVVVLIVRYFRRRDWLDIYTLISIPLLVMPSILSLAFPAENPSLNRTAGALVPTFLIVGIALDGQINAIRSRLGMMWGGIIASGLALLLLVVSVNQNYDRVFNQYQQVYELSSWNTSEIGGVVRSFAEMTGSPDTAWLVAYPHWVDSRLVMINAGYPDRDNALWPEHFIDTLQDPRPKLFLLNPLDSTDLEALQALYPQGSLQTYPSRVETKDFYMFFVPANQ